MKRPSAKRKIIKSRRENWTGKMNLKKKTTNEFWFDDIKNIVNTFPLNRRKRWTRLGHFFLIETHNPMNSRTAFAPHKNELHNRMRLACSHIQGLFRSFFSFSVFGLVFFSSPSCRSFSVSQKHIVKHVLVGSSFGPSIIYMHHIQYLSSFSRPICSPPKRYGKTRFMHAFLLCVLLLPFSVVACMFSWKTDTNREIALKAVMPWHILVCFFFFFHLVNSFVHWSRPIPTIPTYESHKWAVYLCVG